MNRVENKENEVKREYEKITQQGEYEGLLFKNTKSRFQPAYNLVINDKLVMNITGYMAKQIRQVEGEIINKKVKLLIEKVHTNKYNKDFLKIVSLKVYPNSVQSKLTIEYIKE